MLKKLTFVFLVALVSSCKTSSEQPGCTPQVCTDIFMTVGIHFTDNAGKPISVINFTATNQRTHLKMQRNAPQNEMLAIGYYVVADDLMKSQLSTEGDDI